MESIIGLFKGSSSKKGQQTHSPGDNPFEQAQVDPKMQGKYAGKTRNSEVITSKAKGQGKSGTISSNIFPYDEDSNDIGMEDGIGGQLASGAGTYIQTRKSLTTVKLNNKQR